MTVDAALVWPCLPVAAATSEVARKLINIDVRRDKADFLGGAVAQTGHEQMCQITGAGGSAIYIPMAEEVGQATAEDGVIGTAVQINPFLVCFPRQKLHHAVLHGVGWGKRGKCAQQGDGHAVLVGGRSVGSHHIIAPAMPFIDDAVHVYQIVVADVAPALACGVVVPNGAGHGRPIGTVVVGDGVVQGQMAHRFVVEWVVEGTGVLPRLAQTIGTPCGAADDKRFGVGVRVGRDGWVLRV